MISEQFDAFLLDLDGVVYLGDEALPEAVESVNRLDERDKELRFLTNDPRPQRQTIANNLRKLEIDAEEDEIITSGWATAHYLSQQDVTTACADSRKSCSPTFPTLCRNRCVPTRYR